MIPASSLQQIERLLEYPSDVFSELVASTDLSPERDFREADLSDVDFSGSDLKGFDFRRADLRRAKWEGVRQSPQEYRFSMRGRAFDCIRATDFEPLVEVTKRAKRWSERFSAFAIIIDNFGANYTTLDLTEEIIREDKGDYMKACAFVYLAAYFLRSDEAMHYCREMAKYPNARVNMFKITKLRRFAAEFQRFLLRIEREEKCPGGINSRQIAGLYSIWGIGV
jgi:hypothetical protein